MPNTAGDCLYHYTTAKGLIGIVKTRKIWATNILYLNDAKEFRHGAELGERYVRSLLPETTDPDERAYLEILQTTAKEMKTTHEASGYVCSFSEWNDDLSQWRAYCPSGGFAIGFPRESLEQIADKRRYEFVKCSYDPQSQQEAIKACIDLGIKQDKDSGKWPSRSLWAMVRLATASARLKDPAFESEQEWRMVRYPGPDSEKKDVDFRARNGLVVPYMKCDLDFRDRDGKVDAARTRKMWKSARVVVGPTPDPEAAKASIEKLLQLQSPAESRGKVTVTSVPYKFW